MTAQWPYFVRVRPIVTWPGEQTRTRQRSNFSAPWASTLSLLHRELELLRAKQVVLQVAMRDQDFRNDGYPRANAKAIHPGVILSMDSPYGPLSYPCDRFTDWTDNLRAVALALESLRKVDRYGVTKRGEQYTGWKQLGTGTALPTTDEAAYLIARAAWPNERDENLRSWCPRLMGEPDLLASTYRLAARKLHPDAGGDAERFQQLQKAMRVLDGAR